MIASNTELFEAVQGLIEAWCDPRCLPVLRAILKGWPIYMASTENYHGLLVALQNVRAFARTETTEEEKALVDQCIFVIESMLQNS